MNSYESIMILIPEIEEKRKNEIIEKIKNLIVEYSNGAVINLEVEEMGKKKLAYEIKKKTEGYYVVINFMAEPEAIRELERYYRITDEIMKFLTIRKEG